MANLHHLLIFYRLISVSRRTATISYFFYLSLGLGIETWWGRAPPQLSVPNRMGV